MENKYDLTNGHILKKLIMVSLPVMGTSLIQMAYNLTDMMWLGRLGSLAVAASGTAGMYNWLASALMLLCRGGAEIGTSQNLGRNDKLTAFKYGNAALILGLIFSIILTVMYILFSGPLISFFDIKDALVVADAQIYLKIISIGMFFQFMVMILSGMFSGSGNTATPFYINCTGLAANMILDPIFIFVFDLDIAGAAYATIIAQLMVFIIFMVSLRKGKSIFSEFKFNFKVERSYFRQIYVWGIPIALESAMFTIIAMIISRIVAVYGAIPIAVQKIGSQVESITWMISQGFGAALAAFVGQNFGAKKYDRIKQGYGAALGIMLLWGVITTSILYLFAEPIFRLFLKESLAILQGIEYLKILSFSQLFMCVEISTDGAFRGWGKKSIPSFISISFNLIRIPMALYLSNNTALGLNGIWWALTATSVFKGIVAYIWYKNFTRKVFALPND